MRKAAVQAAMIEREELKKEATNVRRKAQELREQNVIRQAAPATAPVSTTPVKAPTVSPPTLKPENNVPTSSAPTASPSKSAAPAADDDTVIVKGRSQAVHLIDMMMADQEFMDFQDVNDVT